jgi:hypothetical protein
MSIERVSIKNQEELEEMITKDVSQLESDLTVICSHVPINDNATLDMLCHDNNGQLVIVQLNVNEDDIMLLHGIQSLDYVDKFKSFLKATYNKHNIDDKEKPRLMLVAPSFSDAVRRAVESMSGIRVDLYEWEYLKLGDHKGLRLQPIHASHPVEKPKEEKQAEKKREKAEKKREYVPEKKEETAWVEPVKEESEPEAPQIKESNDYAGVVESEKDEPQKKKLRLF